jgi:hypothetical protein
MPPIYSPYMPRPTWYNNLASHNAPERPLNFETVEQDLAAMQGPATTGLTHEINHIPYDASHDAPEQTYLKDPARHVPNFTSMPHVPVTYALRTDKPHQSNDLHISEADQQIAKQADRQFKSRGIPRDLTATQLVWSMRKLNANHTLNYKLVGHLVEATTTSPLASKPSHKPKTLRLHLGHSVCQTSRIRPQQIHTR